MGKFVIKPWMIITASVVVIGGVTAFIVLNNQETGAAGAAGASNPIGIMKAPPSTGEYKTYVAKTKLYKKKIKAEEKKLEEEAKKEAKKKVIEKNKERKKQGKKPMTPKQARTFNRQHAQKYIRQHKNRDYCITHDSKTGRCTECEAGYLRDEDWKCHGKGSGECNHPHHYADKDGRVLADVDDKDKKAEMCKCPAIHLQSGTIHQMKDGVCSTLYRSNKDPKKTMIIGPKEIGNPNIYNDYTMPVYATFADHEEAVKSGEIHPDVLKYKAHLKEKETEDEDKKDLKTTLEEQKKFIKSKKGEDAPSFQTKAGEQDDVYGITKEEAKNQLIPKIDDFMTKKDPISRIIKGMEKDKKELATGTGGGGFKDEFTILPDCVF